MSFVLCVGPVFSFALQGNQLFEGVYGLDGSNNAGEYLSVDQATGDVMVYVDSDAVGGGFGFLKLEPVKG